MTKKKKYMIIGIFILMITLVGSIGTYAWFTWKSTNNTSLTMSIGKLADVIFNSGNDISTSTLAPVFNYTDGELTTFSINNRDTTGTTIEYSVKLNITSIATELKNTSLKYVLLKNNTTVKEGNFSTISNNSTTIIYSDSVSSSGTTSYKFYLYIDGNTENNLSMMNKTLSGNIIVEAREQKSLATYIVDLYNNATKTPVTNNSINYQYDTANSLMKDIGNNIRYYGSNPNNYIYFNCSDYSNQSSSTCETWRIMGVFNGKVKLMRGSSIGMYSWDNKNTSTGAETAYGKNDWTSASLMKLLNPGHESETNGGSLYYNSKSGNCYAGQNNTTVTCNFTATGIKNDKTRSLISEEVWTLRNSSTNYANEAYNYENGQGSVYSGRSTTWTGKVALAYPSDYGYATDLSKCNHTLIGYENSDCTSNNWIKTITSSNNSWLLTPYETRAYCAWYIYSTGYISSSYDTYNTGTVIPVLYLNADTVYKSGNGESTNPYQLSV